METNLLLPPLQYCKCKTSLSLRVCVVFRGPWKKGNICESKSSVDIGRNGRGPGIHGHCLPRGFLRAPFHTAPLPNFIPVFLCILQEVLLPGKVFEGKNGYMGNRAKLQYLLMIFQFLECKIYWCKTEIAPGRINFVMEVFISYQQLKEEKQTFGADSGMCSELLNSTRLVTEIVTSRPHSVYGGRGLSLSPLPVALVCFPAIWTEGASLKTWSLQSGLSGGTVPKELPFPCR